MIRRRWLFILPVPLTVALTLYVISHLLERVLAVLPWDMDMQWSVIRLTILVLAAPVYGFYRVGAFHPFFRPAYRQFLARSPWRWGKPLPLGPVHLTWRDLVFMSGLAGLIYVEEMIAGPTLVAPPDGAVPSWFLSAIAMFLFAGAYLITLWLAIREDKVTLLVVVFILPLAVYPLFNIWVAVATLALIYLILLVGLKRTLGRFPWNEPEWMIPPQQRYLNEAMRGGVIGWPYRSLGPATKVPRVLWYEAIVLAALPVWWVHALFGAAIYCRVEVMGGNGEVNWAYFVALLQGTNTRASTSMVGPFIFYCGGLAVLRGLIYFYGYLPPISLRGRLFTGRFIIPGYDQMLVVPALVVLFGIYGPRLLGHLPIPALLFPATCIFIPLWMTLALGPTLRRWRLLGTHRIINVPPAGAKRRQQQQQNNLNNIQINLFGR